MTNFCVFGINAYGLYLWRPCDTFMNVPNASIKARDTYTSEVFTVNRQALNFISNTWKGAMMTVLRGVCIPYSLQPTHTRVQSHVHNCQTATVTPRKISRERYDCHKFSAQQQKRKKRIGWATYLAANWMSNWRKCRRCCSKPCVPFRREKNWPLRCLDDSSLRGRQIEREK